MAWPLALGLERRVTQLQHVPRPVRSDTPIRAVDHGGAGSWTRLKQRQIGAAYLRRARFEHWTGAGHLVWVTLREAVSSLFLQRMTNWDL